jgi:hypothetical protein
MPVNLRCCPSSSGSSFRRILPGVWLASLMLGFLLPARAAADPCAGLAHCQNLGPFTATVLKVNVTRQDKVTAYQGVRTTLRFTNVSRSPLILAYRDHSSRVTDNQGLSYRWSSKADGIGVVARNAADPQFELAPGESREASFEGVLQYSMRRQVAGDVFNHAITIVQLAGADGRRVREVRDHALGFSGLTATSGFAAAGRATGGVHAGPRAPSPNPGVAAASPGEACDGGAGSCQAQGPLVATVVRVNVTDSGNVTAYHGVRTTIRFKNVSERPLIIGYRSGSVTDSNGLVYRWSSKADGMGVVSARSADPQFRLAPGEAREAAFEGVLQYSRRGPPPGNVFQHDLTIAELEVVGASQVRTLREYALSFTNLRAGGASGSHAADARNPAQAVGTLVEAFKALKK